MDETTPSALNKRHNSSKRTYSHPVVILARVLQVYKVSRLNLISQLNLRDALSYPLLTVYHTSSAPQELTPDTDDVGREFYDFYRTRRGEFTPAGASRNLTTLPTLSSNVKFMNFYPFNDIETISPRCKL
ncbi:hypothetical protein ACJ41O_014274 [Fusarium nematophilum]